MLKDIDLSFVARRETIRGVEVPVPGIPYLRMRALLQRFPKFATFLSGQKSLAAIAEIYPEFTAAFCAEGCGYADDPEAEAKVAALTIGEQTRLALAVYEVTLEGGFGPFVENLMKMGLIPPAPPSAASTDGKSKADTISRAK